MARVVLEHLTKTFRGPAAETITAVDALSLTVEEKELLVLVGPSGCGKTTTLRLLAGLETPSAGTISINGTMVNQLPPKQRDVAMVFQQPALYPHLDVYQNVAFGLSIRKVPKLEIQNRVLEMLNLLGLTSCQQRLPMNLSGGERQRVALARALVRRPGLLLLDEPLSNLDAPMRARMRLELARLHSHLAATFIYVTHDQEEAMALGQRIAVLNRGALQQVDTPRALYARPANLFVAGFIGSPPMNLFQGTIMPQGTNWAFREKANANPLELPLDSPALPPSLRRQNSQVVLGLRSEAISLDPLSDDAHPLARLSATLERVETHGADNLLYLRRGDSPFVARTASTPPARPGELLHLSFDVRQAHFFDPSTQARIPNENTENQK